MFMTRMPTDILKHLHTLYTILKETWHFIGILDSQVNPASSAGSASETKSSFSTQANSRRGIIVADDLKETQTNIDRGSGGGGGCC